MNAETNVITTVVRVVAGWVKHLLDTNVPRIFASAENEQDIQRKSNSIVLRFFYRSQPMCIVFN
jgi:hypothetical protein